MLVGSARPMDASMKSQLSRRFFTVAVLTAVLGLVFPTAAKARRGRGRGGRDDDDYRDYEGARRSLERGETVPLSAILEEVRKVVDGDVLDVELLRVEGGPEYKIKMLSRTGKYFLVWVDARTKVIRKLQEQ